MNSTKCLVNWSLCSFDIYPTLPKSLVQGRRCTLKAHGKITRRGYRCTQVYLYTRIHICMCTHMQIHLYAPKDTKTDTDTDTDTDTYRSYLLHSEMQASSIYKMQASSIYRSLLCDIGLFCIYDYTQSIITHRSLLCNVGLFCVIQVFFVYIIVHSLSLCICFLCAIQVSFVSIIIHGLSLHIGLFCVIQVSFVSIIIRSLSLHIGLFCVIQVSFVSILIHSLSLHIGLFCVYHYTQSIITYRSLLFLYSKLLPVGPQMIHTKEIYMCTKRPAASWIENDDKHKRDRYKHKRDQPKNRTHTKKLFPVGPRMIWATCSAVNSVMSDSPICTSCTQSSSIYKKPMNKATMGWL